MFSRIPSSLILPFLLSLLVFCTQASALQSSATTVYDGNYTVSLSTPDNVNRFNRSYDGNGNSLDFYETYCPQANCTNSPTKTTFPINTTSWPFSGKPPGVYYYSAVMRGVDVNSGQSPYGINIEDSPSLTVTVLAQCCGPSTAIDMSRYDIFYGDFNGDGKAGDIYAYDRGNLLLIGFDGLLVPIFPGGPNSFVYYQDDTLGYRQPVAANLPFSSLSSAQRATAGVDYWVRDINADGLLDIFVRGKTSGGSSSLYAFGKSLGFPMVGAVYNAAGQDLYASKTKVLTFDASDRNQRIDFIDKSGDSKLELVHYRDSVLADEIYSGVLTGFTAGLSIGYDPSPKFKPANSVGVSQVSFTVNEQGAATIGMPISLPSGVSGVTPTLGLAYSSQSSVGPMGMGWNFSGYSMITRCPRTMLHDGGVKAVSFTADDERCLDGQRLIKVPGKEEYRTEIDSGVIVRVLGSGATAYYVAEAKDGSIKYFGKTPNSRQVIFSSEANGVLGWALTKACDSTLNCIEYNYANDSSDPGGFRLTDIFYAIPQGSTSAEANAKVSFSYEDRPDVSQRYLAGVSLLISKRLSSVSVFNRTSSSQSLQQIKLYSLYYNRVSDVAVNQQASLLMGVQECAGADGSYCLNPTKFTWSPQSEEYYYGTSFDSYPFDAKWDEKVIHEADGFLSDLVPMDINGDGLNDLVWIEADRQAGTQDHYAILRGKIYNKASDTFVDGAFSRDGIAINNQGNEGTTFKGGVRQQMGDKRLELRPLDFNSDGHMDLGVFFRDSDYLHIYLSEPMSDGSWRLNLNQLPSPSQYNDNSLFADVDGDGLSDIVQADGVYFLKKRSGTLPADEAIKNAFGAKVPTDLSAISFKPFLTVSGTTSGIYGRGGTYISNAGMTPTRSLIPAGDLNGDGAADFILIDRSTVTNSEYRDFKNCKQENYYAILNDGLGLKYTLYAYLGNRTVSSGCWGNDPFPDPLAQIQLADVNGDGLNDVFISNLDPTASLPKQETLYLHMNTGKGFSGIDSLGVSAVANKILSVADMETLKLSNVQIMDVDGDGYGDFTWRWSWDTANYEANGHSSYRRWLPRQQGFSSEFKDFNTHSLKISWNSHDDFTTRQVYADFNGDGLPDMLGSYGPNLRYYPNKAKGGIERHITQIENGLGAKTNIEYERLTESSHYNSLWRTFRDTNSFGFFNVDSTFSKVKSNFYTYLNKTTVPAGSQPQITTNVPTLEYWAPIPLVTKVTGDMPTASSGSGSSAASSVEYFYSHARLQPGGRGYLGFESVVTKDLFSATKTETRYRQDWPYIGSPSLTITKTANGVITAIKSNDYSLAGKYNGVAWNTKASEASPSGGSKQFGPLFPYVKSSTEITFATESATDWVNINGLQQVKSIQGSAVISCILPFACSKAGTTNQLVQMSATTTQEYDEVGNPLKIIITKQNADGTYKHETTTVNEYWDNSTTSQLTITLQGDDRSPRLYSELGRLGNTTVTTSIKRPGITAAALESKWSSFYYYKTGPYTGLLSSESLGSSSAKGSPYYFKKQYTYGVAGVKTKVDTTYYDLDYDFAGTLVNNNNLVTRSQEWVYDATGRYLDAEIKDYGTGYFDTSGTAARVQVQKVLERDVFGTPTKIKTVDHDSVNAVVTVVTDPFGRVIKTSDTSGKQSSTEFVDCRISACSVDGAVMLTSVTGNDGSYSYTYADKLLRPIRKATADIKGGGKLNNVDIEYDPAGRVKRQSSPYPSGQTPDANGWSSNGYDIFGRVVASVEPNGTSNGLVTSVLYRATSKETTFEGRVRKENYTPIGELSEVIDPLGAKLVYGYNAKSQLETITKTAKSDDTFLGTATVVTRLYYDDFGRKTRMDDPDKGSWSYKYNAMGELVWQKDGNGQVTRQRYDKFGRLERRTTYTSNGAVADHTRWYFDGKKPEGTTVSNATYIGLGSVSAVVLAGANGANDELCAVAATCQHKSATSFDSLGRSTSVSHAYYYKGSLVSSYADSVQYDALGRVQYRFDALNSNVRSTSGGAPWTTSGTETLYGSAGHVIGTKDIRSGRTVYSAYEQNAAGQITGANVGAAIVTNNYDAYTGLLKSQVAKVGLRSIQDITYTWDKFDTLTSRSNTGMVGSTNVRRNLNEAFCYDKLNRLTHVTAGSLNANCGASAAMVYDSFGNIRSKDGVTYTYDAARPHAVSSISTGEAYAYDANGNNLATTGSSSRSIKYSVFDKPYEITAGANLTSLAYDADRNQFYQEDGKTGQAPSVVTINMGSVQKVIKGGQVQWKRSLAGVAMFEETTDLNGVIVAGKTTQESYFYKDHVGSIDAIADVNGNVLENLSFDSWGQRRNAQTWAKFSTSELMALMGINTSAGFGASNLAGTARTTQGFTGHTMLDDTGLIHMGGRIYDPKLARFMQADPYIQAGTNTQSYNRYGYTFNNPLNATDPTGYSAASARYEVRRAAGAVLAIVVSVACYGTCSPLAYAGWMAAASATGAAIAGANTGGILRAGLIGFATGYAQGVANGFTNIWEKAALVGVTNGMAAQLQGGDGAHSIVSAGLGALVGSAGIGGNPILDIGIAAVIGGTASELTGGKFANGAGTAAFASALFTLGEGIAQGISDWKNATPEIINVTKDRNSTTGYTTSSVTDPSQVKEDVFINGILNTKVLAIRNGFMQTGSDSFTLVYNKTSGFIADLTESTLGKLVGPSSTANAFAGLISSAPQISNIVAHSQGSIMLTNAMKILNQQNFKFSGPTKITFNGGAANYALGAYRARQLGGSFTPISSQNSHYFDPVSNLVGMNTVNPIRIGGSVLWGAPNLFTSLSPHGSYSP